MEFLDFVLRIVYLLIGGIWYVILIYIELGLVFVDFLFMNDDNDNRLI